MLTGACAVLLLVVGGLVALQQAAMLSALPFTIIVALLGISLILELRKDPEFQLLRHLEIVLQGRGSYEAVHGTVRRRAPASRSICTIAIPPERCGTPIRRESFMNRSSYSCPVCQPRPRASSARPRRS